MVARLPKPCSDSFTVSFSTRCSLAVEIIDYLASLVYMFDQADGYLRPGGLGESKYQANS